MTERTGPTPDPADPEGLRFAVSQQGIALGRQADALSQITAAQQELFRRLDGLTQTLMDVSGQLASPATAASLPAPGNIVTSASGSSPENFRIQPEPFFGDVDACGGFLLQCRLLFQQAPRILAVEAGWSDPALKGVFYQSLNENIKDHLCTQPETNTFEELVTAALRSDARLRERHRERPPPSRKSPALPTQYASQQFASGSPPEVRHSQTDEPMQVGHSRLTPEERQRRREEGACFYCGKIGHQVNQCRARLNSGAPR
ncbi:uncharacterized protein LOC111947328 [Oryzias latipes]|uniref:uncharacterized protein LOC111947328 n=1 Tax=Oryzias latipes TaxID=8090 RepID=UPI000CE1D539|nr:uncharacterized protein LOC111947328 [Oryzias latipes]